MASTRAESAYVNGTAASAIKGTVAQSEAFYEKLLQLHRDVVAGKHPRLSFAQPTVPANVTPAIAHSQTETSSHLQTGPDNAAAVQSSALSATSTPAKAAGQFSRNEPTDDPVRLKRIKEQRQQLERSIAEYAKLADEPILKTAREIPLNLLALAQAQVAPISGLKQDSSDDSSFDEDSYYSSKANSWSTEHTEPRQQTRGDAHVVVSDEDNEDLYEPPSQVHGQAAMTGQSKAARYDTVNSGEWEPDWDEEDDYEPPAPAAFGGSSHGRSGPQSSSASRQNHGQMPPPQHTSRSHGMVQDDRNAPMPTVALNHIPTPAAPQPSRISPLTTGNITQTMQSQIDNVQQAQIGQQYNTQGNGSASSAKELKKQKRMAKKEAKAAAEAESSRKRKRGATPPGQSARQGKRRAVDSIPEAYIKPEPMSPLPPVASAPSRRSSISYRNPADAAVQSSPYRPRSSHMSDQEHSPQQYRYLDSSSADRMAMPPPKVRRTERDDQDLRRVASLQYARRPLSPDQEAVTYASSRSTAPRYEYEEYRSASRAAYREPSIRPSTARPPRSPSPRGDPYAPRHALPAPRPGQIVTDAYGNRYIAELVPEYAPSSRRSYYDDPYAQYPPSRRVEAYPEDAYREVHPSRAYSRVPESGPAERRSRAYSHAPEPVADPRPARSYSVYPTERAPQHRERRHPDDPAYESHRAPNRYQDPLSPRAVHSSDRAPIPRAYSVHPEAAQREAQVEYLSTRAGSVAPSASYTRRSEMAPPAVPAIRAREAARLDEDYRYAVPQERDPYGERRVVSYRY